MKIIHIISLALAATCLAATNSQAKYCDDETDLVYYGYRYYNPSTGRWLSRDPIGERGFRTVYAEVIQQRERNRLPKSKLDYVFVGNEGISHIDWLGLATVQAFVLTEIRAPDAEAGVKTMHSVVVNDWGKIVSVTTYVGATEVGGVPVAGTGSFWQLAWMETRCCNVSLMMDATAHSAFLPSAFDIDYKLSIDLNFCTRRGMLHGVHDDYPSYVVRVAGQTLVDWSQVGTPVGLYGAGTVPMNVGFSF